MVHERIPNRVFVFHGPRRRPVMYALRPRTKHVCLCFVSAEISVEAYSDLPGIDELIFMRGYDEDWRIS